MKSTHTGGIQEHLNTKCLNASISFEMYISVAVSRDLHI